MLQNAVLQNAVPTASSTEEGLAGLSAGQRAWLWFCADPVPPTPMLLLSPFAEDPQMKRLLEQTAAARVPPGVRPVMGIASVDADGHLALGAPGLTAAHLAGLARWAALRLPAHPRLARLSGATMHALDDAGVVLATHRDPALWADFPPLQVRGTIRHSAHLLDRLKPGQDAWLWMTLSGPGGQPFLALGSVRRDPDGRRLAEDVAEIRRRSPRPGRQLGGSLQITGEGGVLISTAAPVKNAAKLLAALLEAHGPLLARLSGARLVQLREGRIVGAGRGAAQS